MGFGDLGVFKIISQTRENDYQRNGNLKSVRERRIRERGEKIGVGNESCKMNPF